MVVKTFVTGYIDRGSMQEKMDRSVLVFVC